MKNIICIILTVGLLSCNPKIKEELPLLKEVAFNKTINDKEVSLYTLKSDKGMVMQVTNYGGRVVSLCVPDRNNKFEDVVLGYDNIDEYINNENGRFYGPVVGRYANRITNGQFELDGNKYQLPVNNNGQTLHGGLKGLDGVVWNVDKITHNSIILSYTSPDGEEGFPGMVKFEMTYTLTPENEFKIEYNASTDKPTIVNLSHHGLFNLKGAGNGTITDNLLTINADRITPVDSVLIPTGEMTDVSGTPFDFRKASTIGERIDTNNEQLKNGAGYDHNWVLNRKSNNGIELAAILYEPQSGRMMEVFTDQPGLQFYSGNFFDGKDIGKNGKYYKYREGLALETQKFPDSPNQPSFPSTRLNPGNVYTHTCIYKFSIK